MQIDVHDTKRRIERAYESIRKNPALPDTEKQKILVFDEFLAAKQIEELQQQHKDRSVDELEVKKLSQELEEVQFAVRMLQDVSGLKVVE